MKELVWVSISLFCNKRNIPNLLKNSIETFIININNEGFIKGWFFEFNNTNGENVSLQLLTPVSLAFKVAAAAKKHFTPFLSQLELLNPPLNLPDNLFIPFPENTIQFGLYENKYLKEITVDETEVMQGISEVLLNVFKEEVDDETIITTCLYLHLALIKKVLELCPHNAYLLKSYYLTQDADSQNLPLLTFLEEKGTDNQNILQEIWMDVFLDPNFHQVQIWLQRWNNLCTNIIVKEHSLTYIYKLINFLNKQLKVAYSQSEIIKYSILWLWNKQSLLINNATI